MKFSVILPIYNVQDYLQDAIESVLDQDYKDIEIILVDDGSTDNCPIIADNYAAKYSFIHVIHQKNAGLSAARNSGLKKSKGDYVFFLDSDDKMTPGILRKLSDIIDNDCNLDIIIGNIYYMCNNIIKTKIEFDTKLFDNKNIQEAINQFVKSYKMIPWKAYQSIYSRKFLNINKLNFDESNIGAEDCDFFLRISQKVENFIITNEKFVYYRIGRADSIINSPKKNSIKGQLVSFREGFALYKDINPLVANFFANRYTNIIMLIGYLNKNDAESLIQYININKNILKYSSFNFKYLFARFVWITFGYYTGSMILIRLRKFLNEER